MCTNTHTHTHFSNTHGCTVSRGRESDTQHNNLQHKNKKHTTNTQKQGERKSEEKKRTGADRFALFVEEAGNPVTIVARVVVVGV